MQSIHARRSPVAVFLGALFAVAVTLGMVTLPSGAAHAAEMTEDVGSFRYSFDPAAPEAGAVVDYYYGQSAVDVVIPAEVRLRGKDYAVTGIGKDAFYYAPITAVTIPDGVTFIGERAFGNTGFTEVDIPDSVTSIGDSAFVESKLETMTWPKNVTVIGETTFSGSTLRSIDIPEGVTSIGYSAFSATKLTSVQLPASLTSMGVGAFAFTLLTSVELSPNLTVISGQAFSQAPLEHVVIPEGVTSIGTMAFFQSKHQGSVSGTPTGLQSVSLPSTLTHLGDNSLLGGRLTTIDFPEGLVSIGSGALNGNQLQEVTIPASVTSIGSGAFTENPSLADITFAGDAPEIAAAGRGESFPSDTATLHFLCVYENYNAADWQGYDLSSKCEVVFDYQYDGKADTVVADYRELLEQPATPVRDGYDFTGWFTDKNAAESTKFDFETMLVMGGLTLFAGWSETPVVEHTVSFDAQNGSEVTTVSVVDGEQVAAPAEEPVRDGYTFAGWFTDAEGTDAYAFGDPVTGDLTLYAGWTKEGVPPVKPTPPTEPGEGGTKPPTGETAPPKGDGGSLANSGGAGPMALVAGGVAALLAGAVLLARRRLAS